jgi:acetyl-CoA carboxylase carboxyl transferase subunit alpha
MSIEKTASKDELAHAWKVVEKSRHPLRPYTLDYIEGIFDEFEELKGDRAFRDDPAIITGIAKFTSPDTGLPIGVFVVGNQKGRKTKEKVQRNFGMAKPEGYRKALRIFNMAERFNMPLVSFIDTPGAFPGVGAEERGQSVAIAENIRKLFEIKVPTLGVVIGEGGSGGALALGVTDELLMLENSIYSVISPESCAAILWGDSSKMKQAAHSLRLSAAETFNLGLCDGIVPETSPGAHEHLGETCEALRKVIAEKLSTLSKKDSTTLLDRRYSKFRKIDSIHFDRQGAQKN